MIIDYSQAGDEDDFDDEYEEAEDDDDAVDH